MVTVKYILIILCADNEGEGGTFSCYSLLSRYSRIVNRDPREEQLVSLRLYFAVEGLCTCRDCVHMELNRVGKRVWRLPTL